jgi:hypothetical protein
MSDGGRSPIPDEIVPRSLTLQGIVESFADLQSLFADAEPATRHRIVQALFEQGRGPRTE